MKIVLFYAAIFVLLVSSMAQGGAVGLTIKDYGISFGNSKRLTGLRFNLFDHDVENVNGLNLCFISMENPDFVMNGLAVGIWGTSISKRRGVSIDGLFAIFDQADGMVICGIGSEFGRVNGAILGGLLAGKDLHGIAACPLGINCERINGIGIGGLGILTSRAKGFTFGGIGIDSDVIHGLAVGGLGIQADEIKGIAFSGLGLESDEITGLTFGGIGVYGRYINGLQVGGLQVKGEVLKGVSIASNCYAAKKMIGVSIGLVNIAENLKGLQIGLINIAKNNKAPFKVLPLFNYHK